MESDMESVQAFRASDGTLHETAQLCQAHEIAEMWKGKIKEFIDSGISPYTSSAQVSMMSNSIIAWENFKASKGVCE